MATIDDDDDGGGGGVDGGNWEGGGNFLSLDYGYTTDFQQQQQQL